jgi:hypothetical protein
MSNSPSSQGPERLSDAAGNVCCSIQGFRRRLSVFRASLHRIKSRFGLWDSRKILLRVFCYREGIYSLVVMHRSSVVWKFSGTACGFISFSVDISAWNLESGLRVSRCPQNPSFVSVPIVVVLLQIKELSSNWRICFAHRNIKSSPILNVPSRVY